MCLFIGQRFGSDCNSPISGGGFSRNQSTYDTDTAGKRPPATGAKLKESAAADDDSMRNDKLVKDSALSPTPTSTVQTLPVGSQIDHQPSDIQDQMQTSDFFFPFSPPHLETNSYRDIAFGVYYSRTISLSSCNPLLIYADFIQPLSKNESLSIESNTSCSALPNGTILSVIPKCEYGQFKLNNGTSLQMFWKNEKVTKPLFFQLNLSQTNDQKTPKIVKITLYFSIFSLIVGKLELSVTVDSSHLQADIEHVSSPMRHSIYLVAPAIAAPVTNYVLEQFRYNLPSIVVTPWVSQSAIQSVAIDDYSSFDSIQVLCCDSSASGTIVTKEIEKMVAHVTSIQSLVFNLKSSCLKPEFYAIYTNAQNNMFTRLKHNNENYSIHQRFHFVQSPDLNLCHWLLSSSSPGEIQFAQLQLHEVVCSINKAIDNLQYHALPVGMMFLPSCDKPFDSAELVAKMKLDLENTLHHSTNVAVNRNKLQQQQQTIQQLSIESNENKVEVATAAEIVTDSPSIWHLMFLCEDSSAQLPSSAVSLTPSLHQELPLPHSPLNVTYSNELFVSAYPFLKLTIAVLLYSKLQSTRVEQLSTNHNLSQDVTLQQLNFPLPFNIAPLSSLFDQKILMQIANFYDTKIKILKSFQYRSMVTTPVSKGIQQACTSNTRIVADNTSIITATGKMIQDGFNAVSTSTILNGALSQLQFTVDYCEATFIKLKQENLLLKLNTLKFILDETHSQHEPASDSDSTWLDQIEFRPFEIDDSVKWISKHAYTSNWHTLLSFLESFDKAVVYEISQHIILDVGIKNRQTVHDMAICFMSLGYNSWSDILLLIETCCVSNSLNSKFRAKTTLQKMLPPELKTIETCFNDVGISALAISKFLSFIRECRP